MKCSNIANIVTIVALNLASIMSGIVNAAPDLVVTSLSIDKNPIVQPDSTTIHWTIKNVGNSGATPGYWFRIRLLDVPDYNESSGEFVAGKQIPINLSPQQEYSLTFNFNSNDYPTGNFYLVAKVDAYNIVAESSEINNVKSIPFTIAPRQGHKVRGYVRSENGISPLINVRVTLTGNGKNLTDYSQGDGYYLFEGITDGGYRVTAYKDGWLFDYSPQDFIVSGSDIILHDIIGHTVPGGETISKPGTPSGETNPIVSTTYTYTTLGATSSLGHTIQYKFDWGDGTNSSWSTSHSANHTWSFSGTYSVTVTARCQTHIDKINTSNPLEVTVVPSGSTTRYVPIQYPTIQAAIDACFDGDTVIVANGTYTGLGNRDIDFKGKAITVRSENGPENCIIDCQGSAGNNHRGFHFHSGEQSSSVLYGFTITNGYVSDYAPTGCGGAILGEGAAPRIATCIITGNISEHDWEAAGGGIYDCDGPITNCIISNNLVRTAVGTGGGGLANCDGPITDCVISGNIVENTFGYTLQAGGGLYKCNGPITRCTITSNRCAGGGGGLYDCDSTVSNCTISDNVAEGSGGGGLSDCDGPIVGCTISSNQAAFGGGICGHDGSCPIMKCVIRSNIASEQGGGLRYCSGLIENSVITLNSVLDTGDWGQWGGGFYACDAEIKNCMITHNSAPSRGGGLIYCNNSITNCFISRNTAGEQGAGLCDCDAFIANCTITENTTTGSGGGISGSNFGQPFSPTLVNCILWGNTAGISGSQIFAIYDDSGEGLPAPVITVSYSDIDGGQGGIYLGVNCTLDWLEGNIDAAPLLLPDGYHLTSTSPCLNAGDPSSDYADQTDIDGEPRVINGRVDIGADEYSGLIQQAIEILYPQDNDEFYNGQLITVEAKLSGFSGIRSIKWIGEIDPEETPVLLTFDRFSDDGKTLGDRIAGDGIYTTEITLPDLAEGLHSLKVTAHVTTTDQTKAVRDSVVIRSSGLPVGAPRVTMDVQPQSGILVYINEPVIISAEVIYQDSGIVPKRVYAKIYYSGREINRIDLQQIGDNYSTTYHFTKAGPYTVDVIAEPPEGSAYLEGFASEGVYVHIDKLKVSLSISPTNPSGRYLAGDYVYFIAEVSTEKGTPLPEDFRIMGHILLPTGDYEQISFGYMAGCNTNPQTKCYEYLPIKVGTYTISAYASVLYYARDLSGPALSFVVVDGTAVKLSDELKTIYEGTWYKRLMQLMLGEVSDLALEGDWLQGSIEEQHLEASLTATFGIANSALPPVSKSHIIQWIAKISLKTVTDFVKDGAYAWMEYFSGGNTLWTFYNEQEKYEFEETENSVINSFAILDDALYTYDINQTMEAFYINDLQQRMASNWFLLGRGYCKYDIVHHVYRNCVDQTENPLSISIFGLNVAKTGVTLLLSPVPPLAIGVAFALTAYDTATALEEMYKIEQAYTMAFEGVLAIHTDAKAIEDNLLDFVRQVETNQQNVTPKGTLEILDASSFWPGIQEKMTGYFNQDFGFRTCMIKTSCAELRLKNTGNTVAAFSVNATFSDADYISRLVWLMNDKGTWCSAVILNPGEERIVNLYFINLSSDIPFDYFPNHNADMLFVSYQAYMDTKTLINYTLLASSTGIDLYIVDEFSDEYDPVSVLSAILQETNRLEGQAVMQATSVWKESISEPNVFSVVSYPIWNTFSKLSETLPYLCRDRIDISNPWALPFAVTLTQPVNGTMTITSISEPGILQDGEIIWNIELYPHENRILTYDFSVDDPNVQQTGFKCIPPAVMSIYDAVSNTEETLETGNTKIVFNYPPVAEAGPAQTVENTSAAEASVILDGLVSFDPDGNSLTYEWTWPGWAVGGANPTILLPLGLKTITLTVSDGNLSDTDTVDINVVDTSLPFINIIAPSADLSVQDGITLSAEANDISGTDAVYFYIREPNDGNGVPIGQEDLAAVYNAVTGKWEHNFDTLQLPDGYYVAMAKAVDAYGNVGWSEVVPFSIRNWAIVKLLPNTAKNKAGRTMPVKFSIRIAKSVDPAMPFVYNEDLEIRIYKSGAPSVILQSSLFGPGSTDYRIDTIIEKYITNFKTGTKPATYVVEIWRPSKNFKVGSFTFQTVK